MFFRNNMEPVIIQCSLEITWANYYTMFFGNNMGLVIIQCSLEIIWSQLLCNVLWI
jgi:hypothetical protein